jgi:hypothetical protein
MRVLNGEPSRTYRIAGDVKGLRSPLNRTLLRNYACSIKGERNKSKSLQNGTDWKISLSSPPVSGWNVQSKAWTIPEDGKSLPLIDRLPGQGQIEIITKE